MLPLNQSSAFCRLGWQRFVQTSRCLPSPIAASTSQLLMNKASSVTMLMSSQLFVRHFRLWAIQLRTQPVNRQNNTSLVGFPNKNNLNRRYISRYASQKTASPKTVIYLVLRIIGVGSLGLAAYFGYKFYLESQKFVKPDFTLPPVPFPRSDEEFQFLQNRRVILRGQFDHKKEILVGPRENRQLGSARMISPFMTDGYYVVTPFVLSDSGRRILVNRGWISKKRMDPSRREYGQIEGEIEFNAYVLKEEELETLVNIRKHLQTEDWAYAGNKLFAEIDLKRFSILLDIDPVALFVADKESSVKSGPLGGQMLEPQYSEGSWKWAVALGVGIYLIFMI